MLNVNDLRSEPFLWIHLAGIAVFPIFVGITSIGLGIGDSYPFWLELPLLIAIAIVPIFWMQFSRPFDIFSVLFLCLRFECLSDRQKKILSLFKTFRQKLISAIAAVVMMLLLWLLYRLSPLNVSIIGFLPQQRILGLSIAGLGFFASNLFLQIPLSVLLVLSTKADRLAKTMPYAENKISQDFTMIGIKISKILWFVESEADSLKNISP